MAIDSSLNSTSERNLHYDGWRGMAIALVLLSHFINIPGFYAGKFGVAAFFVLSGALMSSILFVKRIPLVTFYKRRISRIFPVFFIYVSIVYFYAYLTSSAEFNHYFYTLSFLRSYFPVLPDMWSTDIPINHLWSLNVEEHCYLFLGMVTLIKSLREKEYLLLIFLGLAATILFGVYVHSPEKAPPLFQIRTEVISSFLLLSAGYFLIKNRIDPYIQNWMPLLAFALASMCFLANLTWYYPFMIAPILLVFSFHHLSKFPKYLLAVFSSTPLRMLGIWSYSIYLWQHPIYFFYIERATNPSFLHKIGLLTCALGLGIFSYYLIENPIRKFLNARW